MIDWTRFDWETFEAYIAHFQEKTGRSNFSDVGTSLEIALQLASGEQLKRMERDTYYDLFTVEVPLITLQAKKSTTKSFILKNSMNKRSKKELQFADYYMVCNYDTRKLFQITGEEVKRVVMETGTYKNKDVSCDITKCKKTVIWSGNVWKTLTDDSPSWFKTKYDALYDLWYTCKNNVKQQSAIGAFIE